MEEGNVGSLRSERYEVRLTEEQRKRIEQLAKELEKRRKKKKLPKILIFLLAVLVLLLVLDRFFSPDYASGAVGGSLTVSFIDVGQGDCILISSSGENMLIDCGESEKTDSVIRFLKERGITKLDYIIATHPHSDHMGGMYKIIDSFKVGEVIIPHLDDGDIPTTRFFEKFLDSCERSGCRLSEAETGRVIKIGESSAEIVAPLGEDYNNLNNYSVGILLSHGKNSFFMAGDAEASAESEIAKCGRLRCVNVYKAGHHGSTTSSSEDLLRILAPQYIVISCGEGNSYGHPHEAALRRLKRYTDKIYRTDLCGSIIFESDGAKLSVRTERNRNGNS